MTHPHTKPFNLEHAKAGAPVGLLDQNENGYKLEILKYGDKKIFGILTDWNGCEYAEFWQLDGTYGHRAEPNGPLTLVMLPLGYCEGKPVFVGDELLDTHFPAGYQQFTIMAGTTYDGLSHCKWPKPEPKYPETRFSKHDLWRMYTEDDAEAEDSCLMLANISLQRAIQDGDVFTKKQVTAVLEELRNICDRQINPYNIRQVVDGTDWDAILKAGL